MDDNLKIEENFLNSFSQKVFKQSWILILVLYVLLASIRGIGAFGPENIRILIMVGFIIMWFLPFVFFNKNGRKSVGLTKVKKPLWLLWGFLIGGVAALGIFGIGLLFTIGSTEHWYISIVNQVMSPEMREMLPFVTVFFITTLPSMIFSPIGEELFFRGMIHETVRSKTDEKVATIMNSLAFALVHIMHYGFIIEGSSVSYLFGAGSVWFLLMFALSILFTVCRKKSGSIFPAMIAHSTFNLVMCLTTFFLLL